MRVHSLETLTMTRIATVPRSVTVFILFVEIFIQSQWYHRVQDVHCTIFRPSSGSLHVQYTWILSHEVILGLLLGAMVEENGIRSLSSRHFSRWGRIWLWSNWMFSGLCPLQIAVADAIAKSPQSEPPLCNCMGARWMVIVGLSVCTRFVQWMLWVHSLGYHTHWQLRAHIPL